MDNRLYFMEALLNEKHTAPLVLRNADGETFCFKKIAVKKYGEGKLYCVLRLIDDTIEESGLFVYQVHEKNGKISLRYELNQELSNAIKQDVLA